MAGPRASGRAAADATVEECLAEAEAGRPRPVYLFDGDAFLSLRAARAVAHALVPEGARALNLVELDAATAPDEVAAELATPGLFGGGKVVLVQEPAFLTAREDAGEAFASAARVFAEGRQREGARRLLALAARSGVASRALVPGPDGKLTPEGKSALAAGLGVELDAAGGSFVDAAARYAAERELKVAKGDDAGALDAALARGLPPGHVLLVAAGKVDGRLPLVKKLAAAGGRASTALAQEGPWGSQRPVLGPVLASLLAGTGKRVDRGGEAALVERVGEDARVLAQEVEKLRAYVGDRKVIGAADVEAVVPRVAADPFFALGNAVEGRDLPGALAVLERTLGDGAHPLLVLGSLAGTVRRLLAERERARRAAGERRIGSYDEWQDLVLPAIPEADLGSRKPYGFWMKYQAALRFSRAELLAALAGLGDADVAMKSGRDGRTALERVLLSLLAPQQTERSGA
ncbi:MAG TPA: DNA polymerase III subunit delta [Anaeromyxobacter sp.]|nr:DNA polymerase III subunit delta [Anaeromyxobacter sp.]